MNIDELLDGIARFNPELVAYGQQFTYLAGTEALSLEASMQINPHGEYVRYSDFERLVKMMKESEREITRLHNNLKNLQIVV